MPEPLSLSLLRVDLRFDHTVDAMLRLRAVLVGTDGLPAKHLLNVETAFVALLDAKREWEQYLSEATRA